MHSSKLARDIVSGKKALASDIQNFILDVHEQYTGVAEDLVANVKSEDGRTSYERLRDSAMPLRSRKVLDLACGSGWLAELLLKKVGQTGKVIGIDISETELRLARSKVAAPNLIFQLGNAQKLPIKSGAINVILCHLGLMVMRPLDAVIDEVHRVLKPGGSFAFVIEGFDEHSELYTEYSDLVLHLLNTEIPQFEGLSDRKMLTFDGLTKVLSNTFGKDVTIRKEEYNLLFSGPLKTVAERIVRFFYTAYLLSDEGKAILYQSTVELLKKHSKFKSNIIFKAPHALVIVEKAKSDWSFKNRI